MTVSVDRDIGTLMNNNIHLQRLNNIDSVRGKLEYCVDNGITSDNCSPEILEILEDLQDQVETDLELNMQSITAYEHESGDAIHTDAGVLFGRERRPLPANPEWQIDELGNVFNSRGALAYIHFNPRSGSWVSPSRGERAFLADQVLTAFAEQALGTGDRVLFRDSDRSNCALYNLRWIKNAESTDSDNIEEGGDD